MNILPRVTSKGAGTEARQPQIDFFYKRQIL